LCFLKPQEEQVTISNMATRLLLCVSSNHKKSKLPFQTWQQECYFVFPQTTGRASYHFKHGNKTVTLYFLKPQEEQVTISNLATRVLLIVSSNHRKSKFCQ